ncbi:MAG: homocysteine S-methyltransferase family protein [Clostridia bacterium]
MNKTIFDKNRIYIFDGSKGYMLQKAGLKKNEAAEEYNITNPDIVENIYRMYCDAGSDIIQTNTLCSNSVFLKRHGLEDKLDQINEAGIELARKAVNGRDILVAASIGPIGELLAPNGNMGFDQAYDIFKEHIYACRGADIINFETFSDLKEMRIALLANQETINKSVICNMTYEKNAMTLMGNPPYVCAGLLKKMGADVVGVNCSYGPESMSVILKSMASFEDFLCVKPNAGKPVYIEGKAVYMQSREDFCSYSGDLVQYNIGIIGGCCGTTPDYICGMKDIKDQKRIISIPGDKGNYIFSQYEVLDMDREYSCYEWEIGDSGIAFYLDMVYDICDKEKDAYILKYNGNDSRFFADFTDNVQSIIKKPLIFSCSDQNVLDAALRVYSGIAGVTQNHKGRYGSVKISK